MIDGRRTVTKLTSLSTDECPLMSPGMSPPNVPLGDITSRFFRVFFKFRIFFLSKNLAY